MSLESRQLYGPFWFERLTASSSVISRSTLPLLNISSQTLPLYFLSSLSILFLSFLPLLRTIFLYLSFHCLFTPLLSFLSSSSPPLFLSFFLTSPYPLISFLHPLAFSLCLFSLLPLLSCSLSFLFSLSPNVVFFLSLRLPYFLPLKFSHLLLWTSLKAALFTISFFPFLGF
jgi:hypothetical protein